MAETITVDGRELFYVRLDELIDKEPVYVVVPNLDNALQPGWGIIDMGRQITIHKDLTIRFNNKCKYYMMSKAEEQSNDNIIRFGNM